MAREDKCAYEDYKALNISNKIEEDWRQELIKDLLIEIKKTEMLLFLLECTILQKTCIIKKN